MVHCERAGPSPHGVRHSLEIRAIAIGNNSLMHVTYTFTLALHTIDCPCSQHARHCGLVGGLALQGGGFALPPFSLHHPLN